jgi:hypothetical protein
MTTEPMGTIVVNEVVMPVLRIWLEQGAFRVQAQIKALDRAIDFDDRKYDYRLHSMDGQVVLRKTGSGHYQVVTPAGNIVVVSGTPGSWRSVTNDRAQLRRAGIPV